MDTDTIIGKRPRAGLVHDGTPDAAFEVFPDDIFSRLPLAELFPRVQPVEIDLGSGPGQFLIGAARRYPDRNFLGVERLLGRVRKTRRQACRWGLQNARVLSFEIGYTLQYLLPANSVRRLHLSFPDPWPKRRHHRRRLVDLDFFTAAHAALEPGGDLCIKTDHADYFTCMRKLAPDTPFRLADDWDDGYPTTDFEELFIAEGLPTYRLRLVKPIFYSFKN